MEPVIKETAKVVIDNPGLFDGLGTWIIGSTAAIAGVFYRGIASRVKKLENELVTAQQFIAHKDYVERKFEEVRDQQTELFTELRKVSMSVARIEGRLQDK